MGEVRLGRCQKRKMGVVEEHGAKHGACVLYIEDFGRFWDGTQGSKKAVRLRTRGEEKKRGVMKEHMRRIVIEVGKFRFCWVTFLRLLTEQDGRRNGIQEWCKMRVSFSPFILCWSRS